MAGEIYRVILHFRSNYDGVPDRAEVERYIKGYLEAMQGIGQVTDVEVVHLVSTPEVITDVATINDRTTIPAPPPHSAVPAVLVEEPDTGRKTKLPGTGEH
jgi:hypothetical protein